MSKRWLLFVPKPLKEIARLGIFAVRRGIDPVWIPLQNAAVEAWARRRPAWLRLRVERAITRGIAWLEAQPNTEFDTCWILSALADPKWEPRLDFLQERLARYRVEVKDRYLRLLDPAYDPEVDGAEAIAWAYYPGEIHDCMAESLYYDRKGLGPEFLDRLRAIDDDGAYGTTHVLAGCMVLKRISDIPAATLDGMIEATLEPMLRRQRTSRYSDLFAERAALLRWIGREELVRPAWVWRIARGQMREGGWYFDRPPLRSTAAQHPTALSLAVLLTWRARQ